MNKIQEVKQLLINAGFPANSLMFSLAQACFESGGLNFDSVVNTTDNNLTGIQWANASWQHNASKGLSMPVADNPNGFYARFATLQDWANDFHRIVHAQFPEWNTEGRPIDATDIETYVHRLKLNHYFQSPESEYLGGMKRYLAEITA